MSLCTTKWNPEDGEGSLHTERSQPDSRGCKMKAGKTEGESQLPGTEQNPRAKGHMMSKDPEINRMPQKCF